MENDIREAIIDYLKANSSILADILEELDSINGYLNEDYYYPMRDFIEITSRMDRESFVIALCNGYDEDTGEGFNYNQDYFCYSDGYFTSSNTKDKYYNYIDDSLIDTILECKEDLYSVNGSLRELLESLAKEKDEII